MKNLEACCEKSSNFFSKISRSRSLRDCTKTIRGLDSAGFFDELLLDGESAYAEGDIGDEAMSERSRKGPEDGPLRVLEQPLNPEGGLGKERAKRRGSFEEKGDGFSRRE